MQSTWRIFFLRFPIYFSALQTGMDVNLTEDKDIAAVDIATKSPAGLLATADKKHFPDWSDSNSIYV